MQIAIRSELRSGLLGKYQIFKKCKSWDSKTFGYIWDVVHVFQLKSIRWNTDKS